MSTSLVDIVMPTYNHGKFIAEAIESVLAQKTYFPYRLIVGDDCSTDETQAIVRDYAEKYPDKIEFFFSPINLGALHRDRVIVKLLKQCTAKYIAILEGDDYFTDPYKLHKQVDFLETHPECALCFHNAKMIFEDASQPTRNYLSVEVKEVLTLEDIATTCFPIPCTTLFRNNLLAELPECFYQVANADWMLFVLLAEHGDLGYLNEVMSTYRVHDGGFWSQLNNVERFREHIKTIETINAYLNYKYDRVLSEKILDIRKSLPRHHARVCMDQYHRLVKKGEIKKGLRLLFEAAYSAPKEVFHPRRFAAALKNGVLGAFYRERARN